MFLLLSTFIATITILIKAAIAAMGIGLGVFAFAVLALMIGYSFFQGVAQAGGMRSR